MIGLGRMGASMAKRLMVGGHECVVHDLDPENVDRLRAEGALGAATLDELVASLKPPRAVWIMVPSGPPTEETVARLGELVSAGDTIIDGGNSFFRDDIRRAATLGKRQVTYLDVGTSGGVWGRERGYCLMIGGPSETVRRLDPLFATLAPGPGDVARTPGREGDRPPAERGYLHCGPAGSGHFVKMIHNGIEYGMMQAYAEGFDLLRSAAEAPDGERFDPDLAAIAEVWRRGSVIGSWLLDLTAAALVEDPRLEAFSGSVNDSGEGRWTVQTAVDRAVPADVLSSALYARFRSRQEHTFADQLLSAMRHQFGGHVETPADD
jgi:6-phosphogluconate dehydrogenase